MLIPLRYSQNGDSLCLTLTEEAVRALKAANGETVYLTDGPDGSKTLTPHSPEFAAQMRLAEEGMVKYHDALQALAKR